MPISIHLPIVVKTPVDSTMYSAPAEAQGISFGSLSENTFKKDYILVLEK